jgi:hypothetical protein
VSNQWQESNKTMNEQVNHQRLIGEDTVALRQRLQRLEARITQLEKLVKEGGR